MVMSASQFLFTVNFLIELLALDKFFDLFLHGFPELFQLLKLQKSCFSIFFYSAALRTVQKQIDCIVLNMRFNTLD